MAAPHKVSYVEREALVSELLAKLTGDSDSEASNACAVLVMITSRESVPLELLDMARSPCKSMRNNLCATITCCVIVACD